MSSNGKIAILWLCIFQRVEDDKSNQHLKTVLPFALVVGNPARQIGWMSEFGQRLEFDANGIAECIESKVKYSLENNSVKKIVE